MHRLRVTWSMAKGSWSLLRRDRELVWLPILGGLGAVVAAVAFAGPVFALTRANTSADANPALGWILAAAGYLTIASIVVFFQAAVVAGAHERLEGGDPTLGTALAAARRRLGAIVGWAAIASTVSLIIDAIEERFGFAGAIFGTVLDVAWRVTTFLVLPVIIVEEVGAVDGVKRSAALLKASFGERVVADVGFGLLAVVLSLPAVGLVALAAAAGVDALTAVVVVLAVLWVVALVSVVSALSGIFQTVLHRHVTGRPLPPEFAGADMASVIHRR